MASVTLKNVKKIYKGGVVAVKDFNIDIKDGEFIVFVGPSGCGKSTTLRMIAGLEDISEGELYIDGQYMNDVEPKDRNIAMVFQNYALYPYLTVYDNIAFGLKLRHTPKKVIDEKVKEVAAILGLEDYLDRKPKALSGGQRQRVAVGRAIVRDAKVYLFDEPLSNLDAKLRAAMRVEITRLYERLKTTFIYVTHDQVEAMTMGTRIVVMKDGVVQQIATPTEIYDHPSNKFVAGFIGTPQMNFFNAKLKRVYKHYILTIENSNLKLNIKNALPESYQDGEVHDVIFGIRGENLHIAKEGENYFEATVNIVESLGSESIVYLTFDNQISDDLTQQDSDFTMKIQGRCTYRSGDVIRIGIDENNIHLFNKETEESLFIKKEEDVD